MVAAPDASPTGPQGILSTLLRLLVVVGGWIGFVWLWLLVAAQPWESQRLVWLIVVSTLVVPLITGAWVLHNRSIHRRKGERRTVVSADEAYAHDWQGRSVQADWAQLRASRFVMISVDGDRKVYRGTTPPAPHADHRGQGGKLTDDRHADAMTAQVANGHDTTRTGLKAGAGHER